MGRAIHCALLRSLGLSATRAFWEAHPRDLGHGPLSLEQQLRHVWNEELFSPTRWSALYQGNLERFVVEHGGHMPAFMDQVRMYSNGASWMRASHVLLWLSPLFPALFGSPIRTRSSCTPPPW